MASLNKKQSRLRRAKRARAHIKKLGVERLSVHRTLQHIYAQIIDGAGNVLISASSVEKSASVSNGGNIAAAKAVGKNLAQKAIQKGIKKVAFDRSGFKYHGRVKALADAARENGLEF